MTSEFPPQPGGIGNHTYNLALQFSKHNFTVTVIADQRSLDGREEASFDTALPFTIVRNQLRSPRLLIYFNRLKDILSLIKKSDTVLASGKFSLWSVAFFSLFLKKHYLAVVHGTEVNFKRKLLKHSVNWSLGRFDTVIAVSNYTKSLIEHLKLNVTVIPNGIDAEKWLSRKPDSSTLRGSPKLITVGNVTSRKGQQNVILHLPLVKEYYPDVHYHCVGLKTEAEEFLKQADNLGVKDAVTFHGRVNGEDLRAMLLDSDIFVMLSSETSSGDVEGFGIAILEANLLGIPAIGALGCGIEDAIENGSNGVLVDSNDGKGFINAIHQISKHADAYKASAKRWSLSHDWTKIIHSYLELLK